MTAPASEVAALRQWGCGVFDMDAKVPAYLAAQAAHVSKQVFNYWRQTGRVKPVGADRRGRALYRLGDVLVAERDTRRSPHSSRRAELAAA